MTSISAMQNQSRLTALVSSLARRVEERDHSTLSRSDPRGELTSALADSRRRDSEQIRELIRHHHIELQAVRAAQACAEARADGLQQRIEELEKGSPMHIHLHESEPMPAPSSQEALSWPEYVSCAQQFLRRRAHEAYSEYMMHAAHGVMLSHGEESPASLSTGEQELDAALTLEQTATTPPEIHRRPPPMMHFDGPGTSSCWETLTTQPAPVVVRPVAQHPGHEGPRKASTEDHGRPRPTAEATSPAAKAMRM